MARDGSVGGGLMDTRLEIAVRLACAELSTSQPGGFCPDDISEDIVNQYLAAADMFVARHQATMPKTAVECRGCSSKEGPTHRGSPRCASGSIASGGTKAHCSCNEKIRRPT